MSGNGHITFPNAGVFKMPYTVTQGGIIGTLIDLHIHTNGRDLQRADIAPRIIQIGRNQGKAALITPRAGVARIGVARYGRRCHHIGCTSTRNDPAAPRGQVRGQGRSAAGQIRCGAAKGRGNQSGVFTPIHIDLWFVHINRIIRCRPGKKPLFRAVECIICRPGRLAQHRSQRTYRCNLSFHHLTPFFFLYFRQPVIPAAVPAPPAKAATGIPINAP